MVKEATAGRAVCPSSRQLAGLGWHLRCRRLSLNIPCAGHSAHARHFSQVTVRLQTSGWSSHTVRNLLEGSPEPTSHTANCSDRLAALPAQLLTLMTIKSFACSRKVPTTVTDRGQWRVNHCLSWENKVLPERLPTSQLTVPVASPLAVLC